MKISELTRDRWKEILPHFMPAALLDGKHHPCPKTGGKDRFRFSDVQGTGNYFCACSNGERDGFSLIECHTGMGFGQIADRVEEILGSKGKPEPKQRTWAEKLCAEVIKSKRSAYLAGRGLEVPDTLRWHKSLPYFVDGKEVGRWPAMLAPVMKGPRFLTWHVTYLDGGRKAPVEPCRKVLPGPAIAGAAVPLYRAGDVLGVAEGVETAIAAKMISGLPTWALLNTSMMAKWTPPPGVRKVVVFADNDANLAGHAAAYTLAHRLLCHGIEVDIQIPEELGDWNDELLAQREVA